MFRRYTNDWHLLPHHAAHNTAGMPAAGPYHLLEHTTTLWFGIFPPRRWRMRAAPLFSTDARHGSRAVAFIRCPWAPAVAAATLARLPHAVLLRAAPTASTCHATLPAHTLPTSSYRFSGLPDTTQARLKLHGDLL